MPDLELSKPGPPVFKLVLAETNIPAQLIRLEFILPTFATVSIKGESLSIQITLRDEKTNLWKSDDPKLPTHTIDLHKSQITRIVIGDTWGHGDSYPSASVIIRDPLEIDDSLAIIFASTDANNPSYWIKALAKMLNELLKVPVQKKSPPEYDDPPY